MKIAITFVAIITATPALAHHEVVVATSLLPLAGGIAAITLAGLALLRDRLQIPKRTGVKRVKM